MTAQFPVYSQWRGSRNAYLLKQTNPEELLIRIYGPTLDANMLLFKQRVPMSSLVLPNNIKVATHPKSVVEHLIAMQILDAKYSPGEESPTNLSDCRKTVQTIVEHLQKNILPDSRELERFRCPLTLEPFSDPVVDEHGHTFENSALREHIESSPNRNCPLSREALTRDPVPNLAIKSVVDEVRNSYLVPNFSKLEEENEELTGLHTKLARIYRERGESKKALFHYSEMMLYTKDPNLYHEIIALYGQLEEKTKAALCWIFLADHHLENEDLDSAYEALNQAMSLMPEKLPVTQALIDIHLVKKNFAEARELIKELKDPQRDPQEFVFDSYSEKLFENDPMNYSNFAHLANLSKSHDNKQCWLVEGALRALQAGNIQEASKLLEQIDTEGPFLDQLAKIEVLKLCDDKSAALAVALNLVEVYKSKSEYVLSDDYQFKELKALKQLSYLSPSSETFSRIVDIYKLRNKQHKAVRWLNKWLTHLMNLEKWDAAEDVAIRAKEIALDTKPFNRALETIYSHIHTRKLKPIYCELGESFKNDNNWQEAERVYRLGYERFRGFELSYGLAESFDQLSKREDALSQYYKASKEAILEGSGEALQLAIQKIKNLDPHMSFLDSKQRMFLLLHGEMSRYEHEANILRNKIRNLKLGNRSTSPKLPSESSDNDTNYDSFSDDDFYGT